MAGDAAVIYLLASLAFALLVALLYRDWANGCERRELLTAFNAERQGLLDRIESPIASQAAATERLIPPRPEPVPEQPFFVPVTDSDLQLADLLETT